MRRTASGIHHSRLLATIAFGAWFSVGCGGSEPQTSQTQFRPADTEATNIFYVVGAPNGLAGVATDVREMTKLLEDQTNGLGWEVRTNGNASKDEILRQLTQMAAEVGENGSIGFYVSGHGDSRGRYMTARGMLGFDEVAQAISTGRATPLKRLLSFNDSCYSGHWVDGNGSLPADEEFAWDNVSEGPAFFEDMSDDEMAEAAKTAANAMVDGLMTVANKGDGIDQFFTFAASSKSRTSLDMGRTRGGAFTYALRMEYANLRNASADATVRELAEKTSERTWRDTRHHRPVYVAHPEALLQEDLFPADDAQ